MSRSDIRQYCDNEGGSRSHPPAAQQSRAHPAVDVVKIAEQIAAARKPGAQPSKQTAVTRLRETRYESFGKLRLKIEMAVAEGIMGSDDVLWIWKLLETAEIAAALSA